MHVSHILRRDEDPTDEVFLGFWVGKLQLLFLPYIKGDGGHFLLFQQSLPYLQRSYLKRPTSQTRKCLEPLFSFRFLLLLSHLGWVGLLNKPKKVDAFRSKYKIPAGVEIEHCHLGEWYTKRPNGAIVIPMIDFIKGGMEIPMGRVTRNFLIFYRLCPTQCSLNLFRVLSSVDMLNRKMGINLT